MGSPSVNNAYNKILMINTPSCDCDNVLAAIILITIALFHWEENRGKKNSTWIVNACSLMTNWTWLMYKQLQTTDSHVQEAVQWQLSVLTSGRTMNLLHFICFYHLTKHPLCVVFHEGEIQFFLTYHKIPMYLPESKIILCDRWHVPMSVYWFACISRVKSDRNVQYSCLFV